MPTATESPGAEPVDADSRQIALMRAFNRDYTRRLGILTDRYLDRDRSLAESRLLYEIGRHGDLRAVRARLGLDSGYLSRLLRSLERQHLVVVRPHPDDARGRRVELTEAGRQELAELDRRSDAGIAEVLGPLTPDQREALVAAQHQVGRLMRLAGVAIGPADAGSAQLQECLAGYAAELDRRFPEGYRASALVPPAELDGVRGVALLAREEGRAVGCGAWRRLDPGPAEIRQVWVHPEARGIGLGRRLLAALEAGAAAGGATVVRLGTHGVLAEAIAMYRACGYRQIPVYDDSGYNQLCFEKALPPSDGSLK